MTPVIDFRRLSSAFRRQPVLDREASLPGGGSLDWLLHSELMTTVALCAVLLASGTSSLLRASQRPLWYDEIYTLVLSRLDTPPILWSALQDAVDTNPPLYYLVTRVFSQLQLPVEVSYRIPSTLGFVVFCICLYFLARSIGGTRAGLIAGLVPLATPIYDPYAMVARPYAMLCAALALALLFWLRSNHRVFALLFACALAVAMSLHYYATFALGAFIAGEAVVAIRLRLLRPQVWLGILAGTLTVLSFWPLARAISAYYAAGFWSKPQLALIPQSYDTLIFLHSNLGIGLALILLVFLIVEALGALAGTQKRVEPGLATVLALFLLSPALMTLAATIFGAGMSDRYAMAPLLTAVAIAAGVLAVRMGPTVASCVLAVLLIAFGSSTVQATISWGDTTLGSNLAQYRVPLGWLQLSRDQDLPIVVSDGVFYLNAYQYGSPEQRDRLMTIVDPPSALNYVNTDSVDKNLIALRKYLPIRVDDFEVFAEGHPTFLLLSPHDVNGDYFDWWQRRLAADGYTLRVESILNRQVLYIVQR